MFLCHSDICFESDEMSAVCFGGEVELEKMSLFCFFVFYLERQ